jgi:hypothetical protein
VIGFSLRYRRSRGHTLTRALRQTPATSVTDAAPNRPNRVPPTAARSSTRQPLGVQRSGIRAGKMWSGRTEASRTGQLTLGGELPNSAQLGSRRGCARRPGESAGTTDQLRTSRPKLSTPQRSTVHTSERSFMLSDRWRPIWGSRGREFKSRQPDITMTDCHA